VVVPRGIDPRSSPYRGEALPLSYGTNLVRPKGNDPFASAMSQQRSTSELRTRTPGTIRTCGCRCVKPMPWAAWRRERIGALGKIRTSTVRGLKPPPPTVGLPARTRGGHRTRTVRRLRPGLCRLGYAGEIGAPGGIRTRTCLPSEGSASCHLGYRRKNGAPRKSRTCLSALPKR
jgi:hypothetical protein